MRRLLLLCLLLLAGGWWRLLGQRCAFSTRMDQSSGTGNSRSSAGMPSLGSTRTATVELALGATAEDSMGRRNVRVVTSDRRADVAVCGHQPVGGIEAHPAELRQKRLHPRMCG